MCECGCPSNWNRYTFPAPNKAIYLLTLAGPCTNCDAPSGISIELIEPGTFDYEYIKENKETYIDGALKFEQWSDSNGVAIVTGFRRGEFIKAGNVHLIGIGEEMMDEETGRIDKSGADVILEDMYEDVQVKPRILT